MTVDAAQEGPPAVGSVPPPRVTKRRGQTRARLLDAAFKVFAARGFGRASIEEICDLAGYTRGAFYSNFGSLDELFFALYEQRASLIKEQITGALAAVHGEMIGAELIERVVDALLVDRDWVLVKTDFLLHAAREPEVGAALAAHRDGLRAALVPALRDAVGRNALPAVLRDPEDLARAIIAVHDGVMTQLLVDSDTKAARVWLTELLTAMLIHPTQDPSRGDGHHGE